MILSRESLRNLGLNHSVFWFDDTSKTPFEDMKKSYVMYIDPDASTSTTNVFVYYYCASYYYRSYKGERVCK